MKQKRKLLAISIIIAMIISSVLLLFPNNTYAAFGDNDKDILIVGDNLTFLNDGSITVEEHIYLNPGTLKVKLYNSNGQLCSFQNWTQEQTVAAMLADSPYANQNVAGCSISYSDPQNQSINGYYLEITSNDADVSTLKFYYDNGEYDMVDVDNRIYLQDGDWNGIDFNATRDANEPKRVYFGSEDNSCVINGNTLTMNSPLPYSNGTLSFTVYNADDSVTNLNPYVEWDDAQQAYVPDGSGAEATLNSTSYLGAYMVVGSTGNVDLSEIKFEFGNDQYGTVDPDTHRVYFPDTDNGINIREWSINYINERKEISLRGNNMVVSGNTATFDSPMTFNQGRITLTFYNSDGTAAIAEPRYEWDNESQQNIASNTEATVRLNSTTYEGAYMIVTTDPQNPIDLTDVKFRLGFDNNIGTDIYGIPAEQTGRVDFVEADYLGFSEWDIQELKERKRLGIRGNNLDVSGNSVTIDSPIEGNEGRLTLTFSNPDGTPAIIERRMDWDDETQQNKPSQTEAEVRFNSLVYEGATVVVTSTSNPAVDITDIKFEVPYPINYLTVPANGIIVFPSMATNENSYINWDEYSIRPLVDRKMIGIDGTNISVNGNVLTMDCPLEFNQGTLQIAFYNSDTSPMKVEQYHRYNEETGEDELDTTSAYAQLKTSTYAGAYMVVTSTSNPAVDLTDVKFNFNGQDFLIDAQTGKVVLNAGMDNYWVSIADHSIVEVNERKRIEFYDENIALNNDGTVTMDCNVSNNEGRITFAVYDENNQMLNLHQDIIWDDEQQADVPGPWVEGKFNSTTFDGKYLIVTSDGNVDLSKILVVIDGNELPVGNNGRIDIPDVEATVVHIDSRSIRGTSKTNITLNAVSLYGKMVQFDINYVPYIERNPANPTLVEEVSLTQEVEERENDIFTICVDYGYVIKKLTVNNTQIFDNGTTTWREITVPHASVYNVEIECAIDESILPRIKWAYGNEEIFGPGAVIENGKVEIISVTTPDGQNTYDAADLVLVDDPGIGMHYRHEGEAMLDILYGQQGQEDGGEFSVLAGSTVTLKILPDYGYQITGLQACGVNLVPDANEIGQYTLTMPVLDMTLSGLITQAANTVTTQTNAVQSGTLTLPQNAITSGTGKLVAKNVSQTYNAATFAAKAGAGYEIETSFGLELNKVLYKGTADNTWTIAVPTITNNATISLKLAQGIEGEDIVVVHNINNSGVYEVIQIDSYNKNNNTITFKTTSFGDFAIATKIVKKLPFVDVSESSWYYPAVEFTYENGMISGLDKTHFGPNQNITRGMIVTILWRMEGSPDNDGKSKFTDVATSAWYAKAVKWAADNKIVSGYTGTTKFGPKDDIKRQDLAGILRNYAKYKGKNINATTDLTKYSDYNQISNYAKASMEWAVSKGVITGNTKTKTLNPKGTATRAEAASMIQKYCNKVGR